MKQFAGFLLTLTLLSNAYSQKESNGIEHIFRSKVFGAERKITVYPPLLEEPSKSKFAVAYVFDGQFEPYSEMVRSMVNYYANTGEGIQLLVVGIHTEDRWDEFVPAIENDAIVPEQAAEKLSKSLQIEIIPLVDSLYATTDFRIGIGHSLGGTFVLHEVLKQNPLFRAVIAVSPNLTMYNEFLVAKGTALFQNDQIPSRFIYTSIGSEANPERFFNVSLSLLDTAFQKSSSTKIIWQCEHLYGEDHMTTFVPSFNQAYLSLSSKLMLTDLSLIRFGKDQSSTAEQKLSQYLHQKELLTGENQEMSIDFLVETGKSLMDYEVYDACIELSNLVLKKLEINGVKEKERKELEKKIYSRIEWCSFKITTQQAKELELKKNYLESAKLYKKAFEIEDKRGTYVERISSVGVFAQIGDADAAFEQLELLANYFKLQGNGAFINNPLCDPLRKDARWDKWMNKLEKNGGESK